MCHYGNFVYFCAMKRAFHYLIYIYKTLVVATFCLTTLTACLGNFEEDLPKPDDSPVGQPGVTLTTTTIVYMAGENNLHSYFEADSLEIAQGLADIPDNARVVMFIDDTRSSRICVGTNKEPMQTVYTYDSNITSTDPDEMREVLQYIVGKYPAEHYGITLCSHASGWVVYNDGKSKVQRRSYGIDNGRRDPYNNIGPEMNITELADVLTQLPHFDYILFDACFMQCVEVAYELRHVTDWLLGSPAEIPGTGAPYNEMLPFMCSAQPDVEQIARIYHQYYDKGAGHSTYHGVEISAIRTDKLEVLAQATRSIVAQCFGGRHEAAVDNVQRFSPVSDTRYTEFYDMANMVYHNATAEDYETWRTAYDAAVPYIFMSKEWYTSLTHIHFLNVNDQAHTGCASMFTPNERYEASGWNTAYHTYGWYAAAGFDTTGW